MKRALRYLVIGAAAIAGGVSCDDPLAVTGPVTVSLQTPNTDDGAVAVTISGPGIVDLVPASNSYLVYWRLGENDELHAAVFGNVTAGPLFTLTVSQSRDPAAYSGSVTDVARRNDQQREDRTGYGVTVKAAQ